MRGSLQSSRAIYADSNEVCLSRLSLVRCGMAPREDVATYDGVWTGTRLGMFNLPSLAPPFPIDALRIWKPIPSGPSTARSSLMLRVRGLHAGESGLRTGRDRDAAP